MRTLVALFAAGLAAVGVAVAADPPAQEVQEPEIIGVFYYLDPNTGALRDLERQAAQVKAKLRGLGFGGAKTLVRIEGAHAPLRLRGVGAPAFLVRLAEGGDPGKCQLLRFEIKKDKQRELILASAGFGGFSGSSGPGTLPVNTTKYGNVSYKLIPAGPLTPGEYGLSFSDSQEVLPSG